MCRYEGCIAPRGAPRNPVPGCCVTTGSNKSSASLSAHLRGNSCNALAARQVRRVCGQQIRQRPCPLQSKAAACKPALATWRARPPHELLQAARASTAGAVAALQRIGEIPRSLPSRPGDVLLRELARLPAPNGLSKLLRDLWAVLLRPPGGCPSEVAAGLPGSRTRFVEGPRRWLGLRSGPPVPITETGPWWQPAGLWHLLRRLPTGVWLVFFACLCVGMWQTAQRILKAQREKRERRALSSEARASNLLLQRSRVLRAVGGDAGGDPAGDEAELDAAGAGEDGWQDPAEWDAATRRQWDDFMRKSKALRIRQDRWWDAAAAEDVPHFKTAADRMQGAGELPDYS